MSFRGVALIDRAFWKSEAVMGAGKDLDLVLRALHALAHLLDDVRRRVDVGLRAGEIKLGLGFACCKMRTVALVGRQLHAINRGRGLEAVGKMRRRVDRVTPAHAV